MTAGTRSAWLAFGSLAVVLTLTGCAGRSWQFWKSSSREAPPAPTQVTASETPTPPAATMPSAPTAHPAPAPEATAIAAASVSHFVEVPGIADVRFRPGRVTVGKGATKTLDAVARWLEENPGSQVRIEGHTDDLGKPTKNLALGRQRAESAMKYLVAKGLDPERVSIVSYGSERPVCVEKTKACRARNRRVHFLVTQP